METTDQVRTPPPRRLRGREPLRVLFVTYAANSHFYPMVPLAWALRSAGHEVRVASQPALAGTITDAGLTAVPLGRDHHLWRSVSRFTGKRFAELDPAAHAAVRGTRILPFERVEHAPEDLDWDYLATMYADLVRTWYKTVNNTMVDDLTDFALAWKPDLVLWEANSYAGAIAARSSGAAHGRLLSGMDIFGCTRQRFRDLRGSRAPHDRADPLADWLGARIGNRGGRFTEDLAVGQFTIDQLPDALRMTADLHYLRMRYVPYSGHAVVPGWLRSEPGRPRVALTLGVTAAAYFDGHGLAVQELLDSLADLDIDLVATIAERERAELRGIPGNARVVPSVPLHALLPGCSAAIHHAGFGTLCSALNYGVPALCVPERFDEPALARRVARHGAGLALPMTEATGDKVRAMVERLLEKDSFRTGARSLRNQMHELPAPSEVVPELEKVVPEYRARSGLGPRQGAHPKFG
ncbi:activator-dependent family glycosyltransferase [Amycolatopsis magusensis]|uniref:Glycosyltransferase (Activator-dependent family) n=1 Tax=Amycolatopsis magusensis TaxID=882444 RepID=A0ABS4PXU3_9PSEU|nr:activator-dependent family glycosyltransferase [Amycolatopsis magusensis]MBP2184245.1 glycosyltransferase (activator-dependent family) [Amycolatopsis magusensis]